MTALQKDLDALEHSLGDDTLYTDSSRKDELNRLLARQGELKTQLDASEQAWLDAEEALEAYADTLDAS